MLSRRESSRSGDRPPILLTDLERLRQIRRDLLLPHYDDSLSQDILTDEQENVQEARMILCQVLDGVFQSIAVHRIGHWNDDVISKRCSRNGQDGTGQLCCLLQCSQTDMDPACISCDVIDTLHLQCITGRHEHLISDVIHISMVTNVGSNSPLTVRMPVDHYYVETWQEMVVRELLPCGIWTDVLESPELVRIEDDGTIYYGIQIEVLSGATIAVVTRPKVTSFTLGTRDLYVESPEDCDVRVHIKASFELDRNPKRISMQVIPVEAKALSDFQELYKAPLLSGSSPLVVIQVEGNTSESMNLTLPMTLWMDGRQSQSRCSSFSNLRTSEARDPQSPNTPSRSRSPRFLFPPNQHVPNLPRGFRSFQDPFREKRTHHLVQMGDGNEMRVKLVEGGEKVLHENREVKDVTCSVYDKRLSLIALETTGPFQYADIQQMAVNFLETVEKHRVLLRVHQDSRNIYKIHLSAEINKRSILPVSTHVRAPTPTFLSRRLILREAEVLGLVFRGNVEVLHEQHFLYFSFHGFRGIRRHFEIKVRDPFSQKSLESYHGAVQVWTLRDQRTSAVNIRSIPCERGGWVMKAEFPIILPKYIKNTPLVLNRVPVTISFKEPLSGEIVNKICKEVQNDWYKFGVNLGVSHARIQSLKLQNKNVISDRLIMDILVNWMKNQPITSDKLSPMISALFACHNTRLADELRQKRDFLRSASLKRNGESSTPRVFLALCKHPEVVTRWKDVFKALENVGCGESSSIDDIIDEINKNAFDEPHKLLTALERWQSKATYATVDHLEEALKKCNLYGAVNLCR